MISGHCRIPLLFDPKRLDVHSVDVKVVTPELVLKVLLQSSVLLDSDLICRATFKFETKILNNLIQIRGSIFQCTDLSKTYPSTSRESQNSNTYLVYRAWTGLPVHRVTPPSTNTCAKTYLQNIEGTQSVSPVPNQSVTISPVNYVTLTHSCGPPSPLSPSRVRLGSFSWLILCIVCKIILIRV